MSIGVVLVLLALFLVVVVPDTVPLIFAGSRAKPSPSPVAAVSPSPSPSALPSPTPSPSPPNRTAALRKLSADLTRIASAGGASASISLIELGGTAPLPLWSVKGTTSWQADSTYKLPLLMAEGQGIASGKFKVTDSLCYKSSDYEAGWYDDYAPGKCFMRGVLATRVGHFSDNTAAHILVRYLGGSTALNAFAMSMGATVSQKWLYPLLTNTYWESGIPAGTPRTPVVHKVGYNGKSINDAALVVRGPRGAYVLAICTYGPGNAAGWNIVSKMANRVWLFEAARPT
jgi:hypothetical protein